LIYKVKIDIKNTKKYLIFFKNCFGIFIDKESAQQQLNMQELKIETVSAEELVLNNQAKEDFKVAFSMQDNRKLKELLHDEGIFFGKWNKGKCVNRLCATYHPGKFIESFIGEEVNEGFSYDLNPNELTLEFRFFDFDPLFQSENFPDVQTKFQDPIRRELKEIKFYFSLRFKEGKIVSIRRPKKVIADVTKIMAEN